MTRARDLGDFIADGAAAELVVDTTTLVVDSTNNRVGIGTASPSAALDVTGDVSIADKIIHTGDTNTAIRFPAADTVTVETAGSERMRISSDGTVGILNTISSSFNAGANNLVVGSGSGSEGITIYGGAESNIYFADGTSGSAPTIGRIEYSHGSEKMLFYVNNAFAMNIVSNGDVGIGATTVGNPGWARNLHINGAGNGGGLKLTDNTSGSGNDDGFDIASYQGTAFIINRENADIRFHTNDTERFRFGAAGQIGIGGATYGTSGQVLSSGGASAAPTWADAGGGAYELITKTTISSNVTNISFNSITAPQEQLLLLFNQVTIDQRNHIRFNYKDSSGSDLTGTSAYSSASLYHTAGGSGLNGGSSTYNFATLTAGAYVQNASPFCAAYRFSGWGTANPYFEGVASYKNDSADNTFSRVAQSVGYFGSGTPARIYIYTSANYFTGGEIYLYKLV